MDTLLVISNFDLTKFGCPHCGSVEGGIFIVNGTCFIWSCDNCTEECAVVGKSVDEMSQFTIRNTDIKDLIGNHPYRDGSCQINSFAIRMDNIPLS
jgi:hypothetical protein